MKLLSISILLMPSLLATTSSGRVASLHTNSDRRRSTTRQIKRVSVERNVDDDHTDGFDTNTVTVERNVDDDDGRTTGSTTHTKAKKSAAASSPDEVPNDVVISKTASSKSGGKHHKNSTATDDTTTENNDDSYSLNTTTSPMNDLMDVLNGNLDHDNATTTSGSSSSTGDRIVFPPEHEPSETWLIAIATLFSSMAISLCITTAIRRCRKNQRRTGYQEVNNIVV